MSRSRKSNPISYRLAGIKPKGDSQYSETCRELSNHRKQVTYIFRSFMKRLKAAYAYKVKEISSSKAMREDTIKHELALWALWLNNVTEEINEQFNAIMDALTPTKWKPKSITDVRNFCDIADLEVNAANKGIGSALQAIKALEAKAFRTHREQAKDPSGFTEHEHQVYQARIWNKNLKSLLLELKKNYPYIREKYRVRLAKIIFVFIEEERKNWAINRAPKSIFSHGNYTMPDLLKIGIPASDIVGPWWFRTKDIKSPMDYINHIDCRHPSIETPDGGAMSLRNFESPDEKRWLSFYGLDFQDPTLIASIRNYYHHHKAAPSVEWARRRSNELEAERKQQAMAKQIKPVTEWLKASERALKACKIGIPPTHREWRVVKPDDAKELCERAQRDGLCVVDVLSRMATDSDDEDDWLDRCEREGVCSLLFSTDPDCRTIVGLNTDGKCTSEHHCTGRDNEVDEEAWEYFREK